VLNLQVKQFETEMQNAKHLRDTNEQLQIELTSKLSIIFLFLFVLSEKQKIRTLKFIYRQRNAT
jgi:hypothetical protein